MSGKEEDDEISGGDNVNTNHVAESSPENVPKASSTAGFHCSERSRRNIKVELSMYCIVDRA
jgi:hypothetical protein